MYDQRVFDLKIKSGHCCIGGVHYPRFGGDLGADRHWEVSDVKRLLFGSFDDEPSQDVIPVAQLGWAYKPEPLRLVL